jgi:hypothetical protein
VGQRNASSERFKDLSGGLESIALLALEAP